MSKCKNMNMRKYITPSVEMQPIRVVGQVLGSSFDTSIEGGDQNSAQSAKRRVF